MSGTRRPGFKIVRPYLVQSNILSNCLLLSFFFFRLGEEGEDALRQSAMSSSEIAGLIF